MLAKLIKRSQPWLLWTIALLGLGLRLYGLNWDQGHSFHPDERQIMFHVTALAWPTSLAQFLDPTNSPLNPHFFAYGSFPMYLLAAIGHMIILMHNQPALGSLQVPATLPDDFVLMTLVGRVLSALFDGGTILLTGWLGLLLARQVPALVHGECQAWNVALLAAALVAFTPLQLQLSHFYAVDTMLLFFVMLTLMACVALVQTEKPMRWLLLVSLAYGLALATKFSAAPLVVPLLVALLLRGYRQRDYITMLVFLLYIAAVTVLVFVLAQPYALLDLRNFIQQVSEQGSMARGQMDYPYVRQFADTTPFVYEAQNMLLWGLGITLGLSAAGGLLWLLWATWRRQAGVWVVPLSWLLVYGGITGAFYVKYMRYMLPLYPVLAVIAAAALVALATSQWSVPNTRWQRLLSNVQPVICAATIVLVLAGTIFQGLALLNVYSQPNTRVQASLWMYEHLKPGSRLTYEQWDDALPVDVNGYYSTGQFTQASYTDKSGSQVTGMDLYGDDTTEKAHWLANFLPTVDVITMASDRLDKSIPRLPFRYPLTIHYYQLLFSGQLGFHLVAQFNNRPNLFGLTLDDSNADESYTVFDHPTVRIFKRVETYTPDQLFQKLLNGVQLPPGGANLSGSQASLLLTPSQINDDQLSPSFSEQFPGDSLANQYPAFFWWLALLLLGLLTYPLVWLPLGALADRGYLFGKLCGVLLLAYGCWLLAAAHVLPFELFSIWLVLSVLSACSLLTLLLQHRALLAFVCQRWRLLLGGEALFSLAYLLFLLCRAYNPDLWHIVHGGEKPMELAFLNGVLRSPYMPPLDPWFAGGYINYYYYGYVIVATLIKLVGIVPTTAFNLVIPTLFAFSFSGVAVMVYSLTRRMSVALLGAYFAVLLGNFDGAVQLKEQFLALLARLPLPMFDYWRSSRAIPFTINEFPFWTFLFADLHPHVMNLPVCICMLGLLAALLLMPGPGDKASRSMLLAWYTLATFVFGTIACVNPWDMPVYAVLLVAALCIRTLRGARGSSLVEVLIALSRQLVLAAVLCVVGYLLYFPFYAWYQQLYVNGLGLVPQGSDPAKFLTVSGLWIFITISFFFFDSYRRGLVPALAGSPIKQLTMCGLVLVVLGLTSWLGGVKALLLCVLLLGGGMSVCVLLSRKDQLAKQGKNTTDARIQATGHIYTCLLLVMGLCLYLGTEVVYVRDFLDNSDYERMNTVFKFSLQAWLCFAIGGALAVRSLWQARPSWMRTVWRVSFAILLCCCSVFMVGGTAARIAERQFWGQQQVATANTNDTPTLDGMAFMRARYPEDAEAITWLNEHIAGSPVILEATLPTSYQWFNRVSAFTGLPDVLGWSDHEEEQRYATQPLNRLTEVNLIYSTGDAGMALELLYHYHVRYIYVGPLEHSTYAASSSTSLDKFDQLVGSALRVVYHQNGVIIYEVL